MADFNNGSYIVYLIDHVHNQTGLKSCIPIKKNDLLLDVDTTEEPKVSQVDTLKKDILTSKNNVLPSLVVGIGGGSTMDVAKAISIVLTNPGSAAEYQGWDLVKKPAIPKMGVPTLSGTGAEASRTAVLTAMDKKYGINSDYSMYDLVLMDPLLITEVPNDQQFFTGMDCYIHCVESLEGSFINSFGKVYATSAFEKCKKFFLKDNGTYEDLMLASYMGGASVANSEVGIAHALSYGLSLVLGFRHGIANCIVFNQLEEFYPNYVPGFRKMMAINKITLPVGVIKGISKEKMERMIEMPLRMERPLTNARGENWCDILTRDKIDKLYTRM